jgi:hypothetical protein
VGGRRDARVAFEGGVDAATAAAYLYCGRENRQDRALGNRADVIVRQKIVALYALAVLSANEAGGGHGGEINIHAASVRRAVEKRAILVLKFDEKATLAVFAIHEHDAPFL